MSKIYRINEFAKRIGRSPQTLRRWDDTSILKARRHPSGHRYYDESDIRKIFGFKEEDRKTVVCCRVSSAGQKDDLRSQAKAMEQFCLARGTSVDEWIEEIGGGMNFKRKKFLSVRMVEDSMAIIHTFSCRLYGLRKYKKTLKKIVTE